MYSTIMELTCYGIFITLRCACQVNALPYHHTQCKMLDIRYGIFLHIFENMQNIPLSTIFEI